MTATIDQLPIISPPRVGAPRDVSSPVVVLGGGPCGLAAADRLVRGGRSVVVLEEQPFVGGAAASVKHGDVTRDFGPHAYHVKEDAIDQLMRDIADEPLVEKRIRQKLVLGNKLLSYPLVLGEAIRNFHPLFLVRAVFDYVVANITYRVCKVPDDSFERWGCKRFGFSLYHLCFGQYTQRVWGVHPSQISPKLASQKLHKLSLWDVMVKLLGFKGRKQDTYWRKFYYPDDGIGTLWEGFRRRIDAGGSRVVTAAEVVRIERDGDNVTTVVYRTNGVEHRQPCSAVITTIPVGRMAAMISPPMDERVTLAARDMKYRNIIVVNLVFDCPKVTDQHWIYLLDPRFRFNRFSEQKNIGSRCAPPDKTVLSFELTCNMDDGVWLASDEVLRQRTMDEAKKFEGLPLDRVIGCHVMRMKRAYPMYDLEFDQRLAMIFEGLGSMSNLWSTGRHGLFLNCDMHDTIEMGLKVAENLLAARSETPAAYYADVSGYVNRKMSAVKA